ncbi:serine/threonine protein kinase [Lentisalinibacter sediminis]|uniref:serine/threonine protein kinase n=1 Tax=Lentisalinibacter sediminis TaxID=2992237 RepID=UPI00386F9C45
MENTELLKSDTFGRVLRVRDATDRNCVRRDVGAAPFWSRWLARRLARREARALAVLAAVPGTPSVLREGTWGLDREWLTGRPMHEARPRDARYFREAFRLLRRLHRAGVAHNDLAKEPNWLVDDDGMPALVDFQLASVSRRRGPLFRLLAREDLRHFLKHKRTYRPEALTARERRILATPAWTSRIWMASGKRLYLLVTRRWLGWADREGAGDRPPRPDERR